MLWLELSTLPPSGQNQTVIAGRKSLKPAIKFNFTHYHLPHTQVIFNWWFLCTGSCKEDLYFCVELSVFSEGHFIGVHTLRRMTLQVKQDMLKGQNVKVFNIARKKKYWKCALKILYPSKLFISLCIPALSAVQEAHSSHCSHSPEIIQQWSKGGWWNNMNIIPWRQSTDRQDLIQSF